LSIADRRLEELAMVFDPLTEVESFQAHAGVSD
jgi:hypothetical protein